MTVARIFAFPVEEGFQLQVCAPPAHNCNISCYGYITATSRLYTCCMLMA